MKKIIIISTIVISSFALIYFLFCMQIWKKDIFLIVKGDKGQIIHATVYCKKINDGEIYLIYFDDSDLSSNIVRIDDKAETFDILNEGSGRDYFLKFNNSNQIQYKRSQGIFYSQLSHPDMIHAYYATDTSIVFNSFLGLTKYGKNIVVAKSKVK